MPFIRLKNVGCVLLTASLSWAQDVTPCAIPLARHKTVCNTPDEVIEQCWYDSKQAVGYLSDLGGSVASELGLFSFSSTDLVSSVEGFIKLLEDASGNLESVTCLGFRQADKLSTGYGRILVKFSNLIKTYNEALSNGEDGILSLDGMCTSKLQISVSLLQGYEDKLSVIFSNSEGNFDCNILRTLYDQTGKVNEAIDGLNNANGISIAKLKSIDYTKCVEPDSVSTVTTVCPVTENPVSGTPTTASSFQSFYTYTTSKPCQITSVLPGSEGSECDLSTVDLKSWASQVDSNVQQLQDLTSAIADYNILSNIGVILNGLLSLGSIGSLANQFSCVSRSQSQLFVSEITALISGVDGLLAAIAQNSNLSNQVIGQVTLALRINNVIDQLNAVIDSTGSILSDSQGNYDCTAVGSLVNLIEQASSDSGAASNCLGQNLYQLHSISVSNCVQPGSVSVISSYCPMTYVSTSFRPTSSSTPHSLTSGSAETAFLSVPSYSTSAGLDPTGTPTHDSPLPSSFLDTSDGHTSDKTSKGPEMGTIASKHLSPSRDGSAVASADTGIVRSRDTSATTLRAPSAKSSDLRSHEEESISTAAKQSSGSPGSVAAESTHVSVTALHPVSDRSRRSASLSASIDSTKTIKSRASEASLDSAPSGTKAGSSEAKSWGVQSHAPLSISFEEGMRSSITAAPHSPIHSSTTSFLQPSRTESTGPFISEFPRSVSTASVAPHLASGERSIQQKSRYNSASLSSSLVSVRSTERVRSSPSLASLMTLTKGASLNTLASATSSTTSNFLETSSGTPLISVTTGALFSSSRAGARSPVPYVLPVSEVSTHSAIRTRWGTALPSDHALGSRTKLQLLPTLTQPGSPSSPSSISLGDISSATKLWSHNDNKGEASSTTRVSSNSATSQAAQESVIKSPLGAEPTRSAPSTSVGTPNETRDQFASRLSRYKESPVSSLRAHELTASVSHRSGSLPSASLKSYQSTGNTLSIEHSSTDGGTSINTAPSTTKQSDKGLRSSSEAEASTFSPTARRSLGRDGVKNTVSLTSSVRNSASTWKNDMESFTLKSSGSNNFVTASSSEVRARPPQSSKSFSAGVLMKSKSHGLYPTSVEASRVIRDGGSNSGELYPSSSAFTANTGSKASASEARVLPTINEVSNSGSHFTNDQSSASYDRGYAASQSVFSLTKVPSGSNVYSTGSALPSASSLKQETSESSLHPYYRNSTVARSSINRSPTLSGLLAAQKSTISSYSSAPSAAQSIASSAQDFGRETDNGVTPTGLASSESSRSNSARGRSDGDRSTLSGNFKPSNVASATGIASNRKRTTVKGSVSRSHADGNYSPEFPSGKSVYATSVVASMLSNAPPSTSQFTSFGHISPPTNRAPVSNTQEFKGGSISANEFKSRTVGGGLDSTFYTKTGVSPSLRASGSSSMASYLSDSTIHKDDKGKVTAASGSSRSNAEPSSSAYSKINPIVSSAHGGVSQSISVYSEADTSKRSFFTETFSKKMTPTMKPSANEAHSLSGHVNTLASHGGQYSHKASSVIDAGSRRTAPISSGETGLNSAYSSRPNAIDESSLASSPSSQPVSRKSISRTTIPSFTPTGYNRASVTGSNFIGEGGAPSRSGSSGSSGSISSALKGAIAMTTVTGSRVSAAPSDLENVESRRIASSHVTTSPSTASDNRRNKFSKNASKDHKSEKTSRGFILTGSTFTGGAFDTSTTRPAISSMASDGANNTKDTSSFSSRLTLNEFGLSAASNHWPESSGSSTSTSATSSRKTTINSGVILVTSRPSVPTASETENGTHRSSSKSVNSSSGNGRFHATVSFAGFTATLSASPPTDNAKSGASASGFKGLSRDYYESPSTPSLDRPAPSEGKSRITVGPVASGSMATEKKNGVQSSARTVTAARRTISDTGSLSSDNGRRNQASYPANMSVRTFSATSSAASTSVKDPTQSFSTKGRETVPDFHSTGFASNRNRSPSVRLTSSTGAAAYMSYGVSGVRKPTPAVSEDAKTAAFRGNEHSRYTSKTEPPNILRSASGNKSGTTSSSSRESQANPTKAAISEEASFKDTFRSSWNMESTRSEVAPKASIFSDGTSRDSSVLAAPTGPQEISKSNFSFTNRPTSFPHKPTSAASNDNGKPNESDDKSQSLINVNTGRPPVMGSHGGHSSGNPSSPTASGSLDIASGLNSGVTSTGSANGSATGIVSSADAVHSSPLASPSPASKAYTQAIPSEFEASTVKAVAISSQALSGRGSEKPISTTFGTATQTTATYREVSSGMKQGVSSSDATSDKKTGATFSVGASMSRSGDAKTLMATENILHSSRGSANIVTSSPTQTSSAFADTSQLSRGTTVNSHKSNAFDKGLTQVSTYPTSASASSKSITVGDISDNGTSKISSSTNINTSHTVDAVAYSSAYSALSRSNSEIPSQTSDAISGPEVYTSGVSPSFTSVKAGSTLNPYGNSSSLPGPASTQLQSVTSTRIPGSSYSLMNGGRDLRPTGLLAILSFIAVLL